MMMMIEIMIKMMMMLRRRLTSMAINAVKLKMRMIIRNESDENGHQCSGGLQLS